MRFVDILTFGAQKVLSKKIKNFQETTLKILQSFNSCFCHLDIAFVFCKVIFTSLETSSPWFFYWCMYYLKKKLAILKKYAYKTFVHAAHKSILH